MTARLYSWDDASAPQLGTTTDGSLLSILQACLVNGYGTRTPAGWTMPFSDIPNKVACFKPGQGHEVHIRIDDNQSYGYAYADGYGAMTDVDTGVERFPRPEDLPATNYRLAVSKRGAASTGYDKWHLLATDEWFYFITEDPSFNYPPGFFFGKIDHVDPAYPNPFVITGMQTPSSIGSSNLDNCLFDETQGTWFIKEKYFKTGLPERVTLRYDDSSYTNPNPITGKLEFTSRELTTYASPIVRHGRMPNFFIALGFSVVIYGNYEKITIDTKTYFTMRRGTFLYLFEYDSDVG